MAQATITAFLHSEWAGLVDGASQPAMAYVAGIIKGLKVAGALDIDEAELWERRIRECPGHEGAGGLNWCAYCGDLPQELDDEE